MQQLPAIPDALKLKQGSSAPRRFQDNLTITLFLLPAIILFLLFVIFSVSLTKLGVLGGGNRAFVLLPFLVFLTSFLLKKLLSLKMPRKVDAACSRISLRCAT